MRYDQRAGLMPFTKEALPSTTRPSRSSSKNVSGGGQESPDGRAPLPLRGTNVDDFTRPGSREVDGWPDEKREMLPRTRFSNLFAKVECLSRQLSAHVEQYQVIHIGSPEKACCPEARGCAYLDAMTLQNSDAHVARSLIRVDEQNFLALKNRLATKWWWAIHTPPPKGNRNLGRILLPE